MDFALKVIQWSPDTVVRLQLWDIAGQERGNMTRVRHAKTSNGNEHRKSDNNVANGGDRVEPGLGQHRWKHYDMSSAETPS